MKLAYRFIYYFSGFGIGIVFLIFFFSGKKTSCDYGPDARTLKSIRTSAREYSDQAKLFFVQNNIDTTSVTFILENGDVDFSKSLTHLDSCNVYNVYGDYKTLSLELVIERCDSIATIKKITKLNWKFVTPT